MNEEALEPFKKFLTEQRELLINQCQATERRLVLYGCRRLTAPRSYDIAGHVKDIKKQINITKDLLYIELLLYAISFDENFSFSQSVKVHIDKVRTDIHHAINMRHDLFDRFKKLGTAFNVEKYAGKLVDNAVISLVVDEYDIPPKDIFVRLKKHKVEKVCKTISRYFIPPQDNQIKICDIVESGINISPNIPGFYKKDLYLPYTKIELDAQERRLLLKTDLIREYKIYKIKKDTHNSPAISISINRFISTVEGTGFFLLSYFTKNQAFLKHFPQDAIFIAQDKKDIFDFYSYSYKSDYPLIEHIYPFQSHSEDYIGNHKLMPQSDMLIYRKRENGFIKSQYAELAYLHVFNQDNQYLGQIILTQ